ncbi:hypothetical protein ACQEVF_59675 [Nonomuraea polychroma]|uniref:hypothetical protein n=1 Tax=Nonomuraea polychroma TaxID=46176 RepID=UPI003D91F119
MGTSKTPSTADVGKLLAAIVRVADFAPGAPQDELVERLATIRVAAKSVVTRTLVPGAGDDLVNWFQQQAAYLAAEAERFGKGGK